ncbi:hypothetical protein VKT23_015553 [Stygiomarasmius scandens]|uniref:C2H2-type domain-containing protein n=1 Tax=Marasmiellus scandens TaxID=2682957 RepID=A0ABR1J1T2_9AGAR
MSGVVSLPSIHEMFPEHLMNLSPEMRLKTFKQPSLSTTVETLSNSAPMFCIFRSDPSLPSLKHVASSATTSSCDPPHTGSSGSDFVASGSRPLLVNHAALSNATPSSPPSSTSYKSTVTRPKELLIGRTPHDSEDLSDDGDDKRHTCTRCNKRFNRPSSLRIHMNTHTGATPFRCPYPNCGREFNVNSNMRRHYRNHNTPSSSHLLESSVSSVTKVPGDASSNNHGKKQNFPVNFLVLRHDVPLHPSSSNYPSPSTTPATATVATSLRSRSSSPTFSTSASSPVSTKKPPPSPPIITPILGSRYSPIPSWSESGEDVEVVDLDTTHSYKSDDNTEHCPKSRGCWDSRRRERLQKQNPYSLDTECKFRLQPVGKDFQSRHFGYSDVRSLPPSPSPSSIDKTGLKQD